MSVYMRQWFQQCFRQCSRQRFQQWFQQWFQQLFRQLFQPRVRWLRQCSVRLTLGIAIITWVSITLAGCGGGRQKNPVSPVSEKPAQSSSQVTTWERHSQIRAALDQSDFKKAEKLARNHLQNNADDARALFFLGRSLTAQGRLIQAQETLEKALTLEADHTPTKRLLMQVLHDDATRAMQEDDPQTAVKAWTRCLELGYKRGQTQENLVSAYRRLGEKAQLRGNLGAAEKVYLEAGQVIPENPQLRLDFARLLAKSDRPLEAQRAYKALVDDAPDNVAGRIGYAGLLHQIGDVRGAMRQIDEALRQEPDNPDAQAIKARLGKEIPIRQAADYFGHDDSQTMQDPAILRQLSELESSGDAPAQMALLEDYLQTHPDADWASLRLVSLAERSGRYTQGLTCLDSYLLRHPTDAQARFRKARLLHLSGELDSAMLILQSLQNEEPGDLAVRDELGQVFAKKGDFARAREVWNKVLHNDPCFAATLFNLGRLAQEQEQLNEAFDYLTRALDEEPFNLKFRYFVGLTLRQANRIAQARAVWQEAGDRLNSNDPYAQRIEQALANLPSGVDIADIGTGMIPGPGEDSAVPDYVVSESPPEDGRDYSHGRDYDRGHAVGYGTSFGHDDGAGPYTRSGYGFGDGDGDGSGARTTSGNDYQDGLDAARSGRFDEAVAIFQAILRNNPRDFNVRMNLGNVFRVSGQPGPAVAQYVQALRLEPRNPHALQALAHGYAELGLHSFALNIIKQVQTEFPGIAADLPKYPAVTPPRSSPRAFAPLAQALLDVRLAEEALSVAEAGVAEHPENVEIHLLHAECNRRLRRFAQAESAIDKVLEIDKQNPLAMVERGKLLNDRQRPDEAAQCFKRALASPFVSPDLMLDIVGIFNDMNLAKEAGSVLGKLRGMNLSQGQMARLNHFLQPRSQ